MEPQMYNLFYYVYFVPSWSTFAGPVTFLYHVMAKPLEANVHELYKMNIFIVLSVYIILM